MKVQLIILLLIILGCNSNKDHIIDNKYSIFTFHESDIKNPKILNGKKINLKEILKPRHLLLTDDYLIIVENGLGNLFYVYDKNSLKFIRSIGKNGFGPGEITSCSNISLGVETNEFWAFDPNTKQYLLFDAGDDNPLSKYTIKQGNKLSTAIDIVPSKNNGLMTNNLHGDHIFVQYNNNNDSISSYGLWKYLYHKANDLPSHFLVNILQGSLSVSPNQNYYSISGILKDYIEILNLKDSSILSIRGPFNEDPEFEIDNSQGFQAPIYKSGWKKMYLMSYMTKSSIYSLFIGKSQKQLKDKNDSSYVFQFNYEGKLLNVYKLNFNIISIAIYKDNILGLSEDYEPNLVLFNMEN